MSGIGRHLSPVGLCCRECPSGAVIGVSAQAVFRNFGIALFYVLATPQDARLDRRARSTRSIRPSGISGDTPDVPCCSQAWVSSQRARTCRKWGTAEGRLLPKMSTRVRWYSSRTPTRSAIQRARALRATSWIWADAQDDVGRLVIVTRIVDEGGHADECGATAARREHRPKSSGRPTRSARRASGRRSSGAPEDPIHNRLRHRRP